MIYSKQMSQRAINRYGYPLNILADINEHRRHLRKASFKLDDTHMQLMLEATKELNTCELAVLCCRYRENMTLEQIGNELSFSKERARQVRNKALNKISKIMEGVL